MAKLLIKSEGFGNQVLELKLGTNRLGRSDTNDFQIDHPTVSAKHCEILLAESGVVLRDCESTNGTFIDGKRIKETKVSTGQTVRLGDIELFVEATDVTIAIPHFEEPRPAPPIVLADGSLICPRHPDHQATHQCTHCHEMLCERCIHGMRRRGGKVLKLCPLCSHLCEPLGAEKPRKKSLFGFLRKTVKLPFLRTTRRRR
jgi:hypothetical protein